MVIYGFCVKLLIMSLHLNVLVKCLPVTSSELDDTYTKQNEDDYDQSDEEDQDKNTEFDVWEQFITSGGDEDDNDDDGVVKPKDSSDLLDNIDERGNLMEGDMILLPNALNGVLDSDRLWKDAVVPLQLDPSFRRTECLQIIKGIRDIMNRTCIKFVVQEKQEDYVFIERGKEGSGCHSIVGRAGIGKQPLNLEPLCLVKSGTVSHELMHALGVFHEQSRSDRDKFINIQWTNINKDRMQNFAKQSKNEADPQGLPYDYGSIMHYSAFSFGINSKQPTILPNHKGENIGQRDALSRYDAEKLNKMYCSRSTTHGKNEDVAVGDDSVVPAD